MYQHVIPLQNSIGKEVLKALNFCESSLISTPITTFSIATVAAKAPATIDVNIKPVKHAPNMHTQMISVKLNRLDLGTLALPLLFNCDPYFLVCSMRDKKSQNGRSDETYMDFISQHQSARNSCGFIKPQCGLLIAERLGELQGTNTVIQYWVDQLEAIRASGLPHLFLTRLKANKAWNRHRKPHYSSDPAHHHHHPPTPGGRTTISTPACQLSAREYVFIQN